jgi:hypothetical protein
VRASCKSDIDLLPTFSFNMYIQRTSKVSMQPLVHLRIQQIVGSRAVGMLSEMSLWVSSIVPEM